MGIDIETYKIKEHRLIRQIQLRDGSIHESSIPDDENLSSCTAADYDRQWLNLEEKPTGNYNRGVIRLVDLFSGTGPMTLGVIEAGRATGYDVRPVFAVDFVKDAADNYKHNFPSCRVENADINDYINGELGSFPTKEEQHLIADIAPIDMVIGGPPCQGHSDLNNHTRRDDPRNELIFKLVRFVELTSPRYVLIENVQGIRHDKKNVLGQAENYLKNLGYHLKENLLMASDFGVAQNRRRFILVATKDEIDVNPELYKRDCQQNVMWAIKDIANDYAEDTTYNSSAKHSIINQSRIDYLHDNGIYELPNSLRPKCQQKEDNRYTSVYSRMYPDLPAPTITSGFGSIGQGRFGHPFERRTLTPHEAARVQFIPNFFYFPLRYNRFALQKMIGNAVPPKLTYVLSLELFR